MNSLPPACREFLLALDRREAPSAHAAQCRECADHAAFRLRFEPLLRVAPPVPEALGSPAVLEAIHERVVEAAERAPLGQLVANGATPPAPEAVWPGQVLDAALASAVRSAPPGPSDVQWNVVRRSILADVVVRRGVRRVPRMRVGVWVGLAGVAATALVTGLLASRGTTDAVTIVITDLDSVPGNEFAVLRYGAGALR